MRAPGALAPLWLGAIVLAFSTGHPLVLLCLLAGALALAWTAPGRPSRFFLLGGALSGLTLAAINPFVSAEGDLILWRGPEVAVIDLEVTVEEVVAGLAIGVRLAAVAILVGALLAHVDPDRLQAQVARVAPRSAMTCALAARLVPTLQRDARAISESARLRGLALADGRLLARTRRAAPLTLPLLGASLERGLDVAEAMTARGYGAGPRTRSPERPWVREERAALALGAALVAVAAVAATAGLGGYSYYPTLDPLLGAGGLALAAAAAAALGGAALVLRR
ncbi:energy-coupling factor transporter transmembrane component T [Miltoncostaea marina]|uniref:energy-coupling factor transporter transmembrane component T n=1 Tax=Miltoncostaea marina TaxID=2843215 RepID=UPI001C3D536D|nr:energy-coupling factor transporter transmembrane component T [Miltoncostaea marina]